MRRYFLPALALALALPSVESAAQAIPAPEEPPVLMVLPQEEEEEVFAPFPLRLRVGTREDGILLTWEDSPEKVDGYTVYRSEKPIDLNFFPEAIRIADVPNGVREYLDVPDDPTPFYYAVLGRTPQGSVYEVFIPLKNVSIAPVAHGSARKAEIPASTEKAESEQPPVVRAESLVDGIRVVWSPVRKDRTVVLYRSSFPIRTLSDLLTASWVASSPESEEGMMDYPVPGIGYYYALVDDESLRSGSPILAEGRNVTASPVSVPVGLYRVGLPEIPYASRSLPLPFLALTRGVEAGSRPLPANMAVPSPAKLRPETEKALVLLLKHGTPAPVVSRTLTIFPEDRDAGSTGGEEYTLRLIVQQRLANQDWKGASEELARYLSLNRSPGAAARAHFYRGQALAFSGFYRDAFFEFLQSQERYYAESNRWIDWLLDQLPRSRTSM